MDFYKINIEKDFPPVDVALAEVEIAIDFAKQFKMKAIKITHGYGSHGQGGLINIECKKLLQTLKKKKVINEIIYGVEWNSQNEKTLKLMKTCSGCIADEDLGRSNPGITIVVL